MSGTRKRLTPEEQAALDQRAALMFRQHQARERQRVQMQGLGNPIISVEDNDHRLVAVGNKLHWSKSWRTFEDFLFDYIKLRIGSEWGTAELAKPEAERHPLLKWYTRVTAFQHRHMTGPPGTTYRATMTGAVKAYLHLAYDLYLIAHNAELQDEMLRRLRDPVLFEGAVHEAHVIGIFAKAGFKVELEDETDNTRKHCEFVATHQGTGRKYGVEAKAFTTASGRSSDITRTPSIRTKLKEALVKHTPHERIVCIELARNEIIPLEGPSWIEEMNAEVIEAEGNLMLAKNKRAPPAYLFVTNRSCVWADEGPASVDFMLSYGFKIPDFMPYGPVPLLDAVKARRRHAEMHGLMHSFQQSSNIPSSFDERLLEETFLSVDDEARLLLGQNYVVPDGDGEDKVGILIDAIVQEQRKVVHGVYRLNDGRDIIVGTPITDEELRIYKASPDTFFGAIRQVPKGLHTPMDAFDLYHRKFADMPRENLLERMAKWPGAAERADLSQAELVDMWCASEASNMWLALERQKASDKKRPG